MATYSIVGPGSSMDNPIDVFVGCKGTTAEVCWVGRLSTVGNCNIEMYRDEKYCQLVTFPVYYNPTTYTSKFDWKPNDSTTIEVWYRVNWEKCPPNPPGCEFKCTNLTAYAVPGSVEEGYSGDIEIHYEYLVECYGTKTGVVTGLTLSDFTPEGEMYKYTYTTSDSMVSTQCSTDVYVHKKGGDDCTEGCVADISITFSKNVVPASGATIQVIVSFKKTITDANCNKKVTTGSFSYPWEVKCTSTGDNDKHCCKDHYVEGHISIATIKERAKLGDCELRYEGEQTALDYYYKVLQKAKTTEECEGYCEEKTTYCVDQSSVKVCYETKYLSNKWICEGEPYDDCDCAALSINGVNGAYSVPFTGGRIKVKWQYSAHTKTETCNEYDTLGKTWEEIITIGGCDERPIDCKPEYNTVVVDEEGHTAIYDDTTYKDCKICDSECCYNYDGKGRCKCVILFKEQTPGCTTCESCDVYDEEEQRTIRYNKIRYEFVQDCTNICDYTKNTQFNKQTVNVDKCFTGETGATVPFTSTTEYNGAGCPAPKTEIGEVPVTVNISKVNNTKREKVAYEDDMIKVVQGTGPCETPAADCDCYSITIEGESPTPTECASWGSWSWNTAYVSCNGGDSSAVVTGSRTCLTDPSKTQTTSSTVTFATTTCRSDDDDKTIYNRDGKTVIQRGGCDCGGGGDCSCRVTSVYNNTNIFPKDGSNSLKVVANISDFSSECSCSDISSTSIYPDTSSCSENECSTFQILYDITATTESGKCVVKAKVKANNGGSGHNVIDGVEKWHYKVGSCGDYFNFYQYAGSEPPPTSCSVTPDSTLDGYVSKFNSTLGTTISTDNTPCTYRYLSEAYAAVQNRSSTTIMWMLANVMSELTPKNSMCEGYFRAASANEFGGIHSVTDSTKSVYEDRIDGGVAYALFKHNYYEFTKERVSEARAELVSKGVSRAKWGTDNDCGEMCWGRTGTTTTAPNPLQMIPNMWGNKSTTSYDYTAMASLVSNYQTVESIRYLDGNDYVPLKDKQDCNMYLAKIMGMPETTEWANFIYDSTDVAIASGNVAKVKAETLRPANDRYPDFNYLCDNTIEDPGRAYCNDECDNHEAYDPAFCDCETNGFKASVASYPSGHSFKAFMALLATLVVDGNSGNKIDRMTKYCYHRNVVRAHWHSDVLIGKLIASMDIGYLCGYKQFQDRVDDLITT